MTVFVLSDNAQRRWGVLQMLYFPAISHGVNASGYK